MATALRRLGGRVKKVAEQRLLRRGGGKKQAEDAEELNDLFAIAGNKKGVDPAAISTPQAMGYNVVDNVSSAPADVASSGAGLAKSALYVGGAGTLGYFGKGALEDHEATKRQQNLYDRIAEIRNRKDLSAAEKAQRIAQARETYREATQPDGKKGTPGLRTVLVGVVAAAVAAYLLGVFD